MRRRPVQGHDDGPVAQALGAVSVEVLPDVRSSPELDLALRTAVEAGEALLAPAFRSDPARDPVLVAELERFLVAGLADLLPASPERLPG